MNPLIVLSSAPSTPEAARIAGMLRRRPSQVLSTFKDDLQSIWQNSQCTPQQVFDSLGSSAGHVVEASNALIEAFQGVGSDGQPMVDPAILNQILSVIKPFSVHPDGTVTVSS